MFRSPLTELRNAARFGSEHCNEPRGFSSLPILPRCVCKRELPLALRARARIVWNMFESGSVFVLRKLAFNRHAAATRAGACLIARASLPKEAEAQQLMSVKRPGTGD